MSDSRKAVIIPDGFSISGGEVRVVAWLKAEGEPVRRGETLAEIESEKATLELEATENGRLTEITAGVGAVATVGETIAWLTLA